MVIIPLIAYIYQKNLSVSEDKKDISILSMFPLFILCFIGMGILRTLGDITLQSYGYSFGILYSKDWLSLISIIKFTAEISLTIAMASLGLSTNLRSITSMGIKPFYLGLIAAISVGVVSLVSIKLIIV